ncbi:glycoside hydrolase family 15 protein [Paenibacillus chartarius]|uniref:Glycoside hydrolase family 15 protein n=1 Tax=Paenibacillus chartarius TaxID=747481 RepID=A0ABV6DUQ3_9BACL
MSDRRSALEQCAKQLIVWNQHPSGSYVACPLFANYAYGWLRDGTFIAYAMDLSGEYESSERFYGWVDRVLSRKADIVEKLLAKKEAQQWIDRSEFLGTRFHLDGRDDDGEWGHFQLDGYGTWLWGLTQHIRLTGRTELLDRFRGSIELTLRYVTAFWPWPNFDCWEENPDYVHPSTLACLYGGLMAIGELEGRGDLLETAEEIKRFLAGNCVHNGTFVKSVVHRDGSWQPVLPGVDANLMWLVEPFRVFEPGEPVMEATLERIRNELVRDGGMHRYVEDTYYGGGSWLLLTGWYGWVLAGLGDLDGAARCLAWMEDHADELGRLPEQVPVGLLHEEAYRDWQTRWGEPAVPLLWSHAMYLVLSANLKRA